jgi:hypothetical protein
MSRRLLAPLVCLVSMVAGLVAYAAWNRRVPVQRLTLTERELSLPWQWQLGLRDDESELRLPIRWERRDRPLDEKNWLTEDKLRAIGFDFQTPVGDPRAERAYTRQLPRIAWVALEYDGPAWRELEQRRRLQANLPDSRFPLELSRLATIDAGPDRDGLARRHGDERTLILPAIFQLAWLAPDHGGPLVYGYVERLVVNELTVPTRFRAALDDLREPRPERTGEQTGPSPPRFEVDLAVGRLGFPWVTGVRRTH